MKPNCDKSVFTCEIGSYLQFRCLLYMFGFNLATPRREQISLLYPPTPRGVSVSFCPQQNICGAKNGTEVRGRKRSSPISSRLCTSRRTCFSFPLLSFFSLLILAERISFTVRRILETINNSQNEIN